MFNIWCRVCHPAWSSVIAERSPHTASWHGSVADTAPQLDATSQQLGTTSQQLVSAAGCSAGKVFWHGVAAWLHTATGCPTGKVFWHGVAVWLPVAARCSTGEASQHRAAAQLCVALSSIFLSHTPSVVSMPPAAPPSALSLPHTLVGSTVSSSLPSLCHAQ